MTRPNLPRADDALLFDKRDGVATLTLNRPDTRNALTNAMFLDMERMLLEIVTDGDVRVVVLTGAGDRAFCSGGDLGSGSGDGFLSTHDARRRYGALLDDAGTLLRELPARADLEFDSFGEPGLYQIGPSPAQRTLVGVHFADPRESNLLPAERLQRASQLDNALVRLLLEHEIAKFVYSVSRREGRLTV